MDAGGSGVSVSPHGRPRDVPAPVASTEPEDVEPRPNRAVEFIGRFWAWLFLLVLVIFFSATGKGFLDLFNFQAIGANMAIMLIMALGDVRDHFGRHRPVRRLRHGPQLGWNRAGNLARLGPDAPLALAVPVGLAAALITGVPAGFVNGLLIARLRVPPFIGTLGMYGIARGVGFILSGGQPVSIQVRGLGQVVMAICSTTTRNPALRVRIRQPGWRCPAAPGRRYSAAHRHPHRAAHRGMLVPAVAYALRPAHLRRRRQ